jgi:O-antigen/teichoic acid export membrane protein
MILAFYGAFRAVGSAGSILLSATGRVRSSTIAQALALIVPLALILPLIRAGAVGIACAFTLGQAVSMTYVIVATRQTWHLNASRLLRGPLLATAAALVPGIVLLLLPVPRAGLLAIATSAVTYCAILLTIDPEARFALGIASVPSRRGRALKA